MDADELTLSQAAITVGRVMAATKALSEAMRLVALVHTESTVSRYRNASARVMDDIDNAQSLLATVQRLAEGVVQRERTRETRLAHATGREERDG